MKKRSILNRGLSLMLALMLLIGLVPAQTLATEIEVPVIDNLQYVFNDTELINVTSGTGIKVYATSGTAIVYEGQVEVGNYTIEEAAQLETLAQKVNEGTSYSDSTFTLLNGIELSGNWTPIGSKTKSFSGTFDGDNNTISGFYISGSGGYHGLFGNLDGAEIKNLTVEGEIIITANSDNVGGIAGYAKNSSFTDCTNKANISSDKRIRRGGGIVGHSVDISLTRCINEGEITSLTGNNIGGIVGEIGGTADNTLVIEKCHNKGEITGSSNVGGIAGTAKNSFILSSINESRIKNDNTAGDSVGGIIGYADNTFVKGCRNEGEIYNSSKAAAGYTGGIAGNFVNNFVTECVNTGEVKGLNMTGGLFGKGGVSGKSEFGVSNSYNTGNVSVIDAGMENVNNLGGLFGIVDVSNSTLGEYDFIIENCYNTGDVFAVVGPATIKNVGGLFGNVKFTVGLSTSAFESMLLIQNCYNAGAVKGVDQVGGIAGTVDVNGIDNRYILMPPPLPPVVNPNGNLWFAYLKIANCYSSGIVTSELEEPNAFGTGIGLVSKTHSFSTIEASNLILSNVFANTSEGNPTIGKDALGTTDLSDIVGMSTSQMAAISFPTLLGGTYTKLSPELYLDGEGNYDEETYARYYEIYGDYPYPILRVLSGLEAEKTYNVKFEGAGYTTVIANGESTYATTVEPGDSVIFTVTSNYEDEVEVLSVSLEGEELTPDTHDYYTVNDIKKDTVITIEAEGEPELEEDVYEITFEFTDASSGTEITDAAVTIADVIPENGIYNLEKGTYAVTVTKDNYHTLTGKIEVSRNKINFAAALYPDSTIKHTIDLKIGMASIRSPHIVYLYNGDFIIDESKPSPSEEYVYSESEFKDIPAGEYTYRARATEDNDEWGGIGANDEWSGISIGGGPLTVDKDEEVNLRVVYFWNQLNNLSKIHYTMSMKAADGKEYLPGSTAPAGGIARATFIVPSQPDGAEYQYAFHPSIEGHWGSSGTTYIYDSPAANRYQGMNLSDSRKFVISPKVPISMTVPTEAKFGMYHRVRLYQPLEVLEPIEKTDNKNGTTTYIYEGPSGTDLHYELTLDGYVKKAERFNISAKGELSKVISPDSLTKDTGKDLPDDIDADIIMNAPDSKYIELKSGENYELYLFRNWQAINNITDNQYVDPEYNVEVIYGDSVEVTDEYYAGAVIRAIDGKSGVSFVRVTYGPLEYNIGSQIDLYSKLWEKNTVVLAFNVNPKGTAAIDTGIKQIEFETAYYARSINGIEQAKDKQYAEYTFTPEVKNGTLAKVEIHPPIGSKDEWDDSAWKKIEPDKDGSYTANLVDGRSIVRVIAADGTEVYYSLRAYGVDIKIEGENVDVSLGNNTYNVTADVNDTVKISYKGLQMPFPKLGAIYNPGFPDKTYLEYNLKGIATNIEREVISQRSQYDISGRNTITLSFDSPDTYILTKGGIRTSAFGDAAGGHRAVTKGGKTGAQSNFTGGNSPEAEYGRFGSIPEIKLNITGIEDSGTAYTATIKAPTDAVRLIIRNSLGYIKSPEKSVNGVYTYSLYNNEGTEAYTYALERPGYVTQTGTFDITDRDVNIDLTNGWTAITQSGNTFVSIVGYESILANKDTINISSTPADLYAKYYVKYNHGGYTVLHALLDALEKNDAPFICKEGKLAPSITISDGELGAVAGWICEVNGRVVTDYANTLVDGGDTVVFYYNPDTAENMRHAWFTETEVKAKKSETAVLTLVSTPVSNNGAAAVPVAGATVYVDGNEWGKTDSNGKITLSNFQDLAIGPHTVTAQLNNTLTFARAILIIEKDDSGVVIPGDTVTVTFRMIGDTKHEPAYKGYINWIKTERHTKPTGTTMEELFIEVLENHSMNHDNTSDNYVAWIAAPPVLGGYKLGEFDNGPNSGWMYTVDGYHPLLGLCEYVLKDGDEIIWHYVNDYTLETSFEGSKPKYVNSWLVARDIPPHKGMIGESQDNAANSRIDNSLLEKNDVVINPPVTAKDGVAAASVSTADMKKAIEEAKKKGSGAIIIEPRITGNADKTTVTLQKSSLTLMKSDTDADLKIVTPSGNVTIPNAVLSEIVSQASGNEITISIENKVKSTLTEDQQKAVGEGAVFDISILSNGKKISSFGGKKITISLPYTLKAGEKAENVTVWYMNDDGELEEVECKYDNSTGLATFTTTHLSYYIVGVAEKQAEWNNPFTDVQTGDWFYEAVKYAVQKGLFSGTSENTFSPNMAMTRSMLVTVLYRMDGSPVVTAANTFTDVEAGQWYTDAVIWANASGIVTGYGEGKFGTNDPITREQMAAILYRYAQTKEYDVTKTDKLTGYTDASSVSTWAEPAVKWAVSQGMITGTSNTTLSPAGTATRAQVAAILQRYIENVK